MFDAGLLAGAGGTVGLAVSGGSDSVAMAVLAADAGFRGPLITVDHGLRTESAADADAVEKLASVLGLPFRRYGPPLERLENGQAAARRLRYGYLAAGARELGLAAVATAHTVDDQAETVLMRLGRGSGVTGLSGILPVSHYGALVVLRPVLNARREDLRRFLEARGVAWRDDPSNDDPRHHRVRVRRALHGLSAAGVAPERIAASAAHIARAAAAIEDGVADLARRAATVDRAGGLTLCRARLSSAPLEHRLRLLSAALKAVGGRAGAPRWDALGQVMTAIDRGAGRATAARVVVEAGPETVYLRREARRISPLLLMPGETALFDGRFHVRAGRDAPAMEIAPLDDNARHCPPMAPLAAMAAAPGIFVDGALVAAPTFGVWRRGFSRFLLTAKFRGLTVRRRGLAAAVGSQGVSSYFGM
ncbi:MAG: tRNA lysidine(34) synthetase TilS [Pseudomonadota bacterium]